MKKKFTVKTIAFFAAIILSLGIFSGCSSQSAAGYEESSASTAAANPGTIAPEEAKKRLDSEKGIILLDVRTKEEYESGHIEDAQLMPLDSLGENAPKSLNDKDADILVYCRSGNRSAAAAKILADLGYKNVYDLGGIKDWPYEVVK